MTKTVYEERYKYSGLTKKSGGVRSIAFFGENKYIRRNMIHIRKKIISLCLLSLWMPVQGTLVSYAQDRLIPMTDEEKKNSDTGIITVEQATIIGGFYTAGSGDTTIRKVNKTDPNGENYNPHYNPDYMGNSSAKAGSVIVGASTYSGAVWGTAIGDSCGVMSVRGLALAHGSYVGLNSLGGVALGSESYVGDNAQYAVAIGGQSKAYEKNIVSFGNDYLQRRLTQVASGINDNDAVNVKQFNTGLKGVENKIQVYTAGSDIAISAGNAISVNKDGLVEKGNTGIVTGGTVYSITNKLSNTLDTQKTQLSAATKRLGTLTSTISDLKDSIIDINTSVTSAIISSSATINGRLDTSLSNISEDGKDTLRQLIRNEMKSVSQTNMTKGNISTLAMPAVYEAPNGQQGTGDTSAFEDLSKTIEGKADISYVDSELAKKANQEDLDKVSKQVNENTNLIDTNRKDIAELKENKADVDGSNIDVSKYAEKLGTGKVKAGEVNLVSGGTVFEAMEKKADLDYVNDGFNRMEGQMQAMNQSLSRDIARVGAGAAALAGLHPQEYDPNNKLDFAAGYGHYKNANATAIGMYYRPNAGTTISLAGTIGNGSPMLSAGLSFKIGYGKNVEKVIVSKKEYDELNEKVEKLTELVMQMQAAQK